jgi:hypothetical protein
MLTAAAVAGATLMLNATSAQAVGQYGDTA